MNSNQSITNVSFSFLKGSDEFLNIVLDNINSCVLLLDKDYYLKAFNEVLKTIFSNKKDEDLLYMKCGEAIGCAYQIEEQKECGETTHCCDCELREAALISYTKNEVVYKESIVRPFYNAQHQKVDKHIQFSTRLFKFKKDKYVILIIEDITKFIKPEKVKP
jgi:sigma-B regulation protein RsbU (phosphoserine phosphatase)